MPRLVRVAAAQVGRVDRITPRSEVLFRLIALLDQAFAQKVQLVVFPETTFTTFFPRYFISQTITTASSQYPTLQSYFESEHPQTGIIGSPNVAPFFAHAKKLGIDVCIGYAESTPEMDRGEESAQGWNTAVYVDGKEGKVLGKYRKVHLPGTVEPFSRDDENVTNQLEKRYFRPGDLGFQAFRATGLKGAKKGEKSPVVGMLICNDRRWAEGWRCYGLQGVEIMCIGYNTTAWAPELWGSPEGLTREAAREDTMFHHKLVVQANAYTNATFCITSARCGWDDDKFELITGSMIVDPEGHIIAENKTSEDELVVAEIDLDACRQGKQKTFCFEKHRRPEHYGRIVEQKGVVEPPEA